MYNYIIFSVLGNLIAEATNHRLSSRLITDRLDSLLTILEVCMDPSGSPTPFEVKEPMATIRIIPVYDKFHIFAIALNVPKTFEIHGFFKGCDIGEPLNEIIDPYYARAVSLNELSEVFNWALNRSADIKFTCDSENRISHCVID